MTDTPRHFRLSELAPNVAKLGEVVAQARARDARRSRPMTLSDAEAVVVEMVTTRMLNPAERRGPTLAGVRRSMEAAWSRGTVPAAVRRRQPSPEARGRHEARGLETRVSAIVSFHPETPTRRRIAPPARRSTTQRSARPALPARASGETREEQLTRYYGAHTFVQRHEAGHVVAAWALGLDVERVRIDSEHFAVTELTDGTSDDNAALTLLVAGMRAERSHPAWCDDLEEIWARTDDQDRIEAYLADLELNPPDAHALRSRAVEKADELLARHGYRLDIVHETLVNEPTLSARRLARLLKAT